MKTFVLTLKQVNKSGNESFHATNVFEIEGGKDVAMKKIAEDAAKFCRALIKLHEECEADGFRSAVNGIKKSLPMQIVISGTKIEMSYRNFGKFVREGNEAQVRRVLLKHFVFIEKYSGYSA